MGAPPPCPPRSAPRHVPPSGHTPGNCSSRESGQPVIKKLLPLAICRFRFSSHSPRPASQSAALTMPVAAPSPKQLAAPVHVDMVSLSAALELRQILLVGRRLGLCRRHRIRLLHAAAAQVDGGHWRRQVRGEAAAQVDVRWKENRVTTGIAAAAAITPLPWLPPADTRHNQIT